MFTAIQLGTRRVAEVHPKPFVHAKVQFVDWKMLGDGAGEDGRICSACTEALKKRFEMGMPAGANVLLRGHLDWGMKNKLPFPSPPSHTILAIQNMNRNVHACCHFDSRDIPYSNDSKVRMWLTGFGFTFNYRGETLISVFHATVFRQYTAFNYYWREMKGMDVGDSQVIYL